MKDYKNIEKIDTLDDGTMNVLMKNGKGAVVEIIRLNEKFQAAIYKLFAPDFEQVAQREGSLARLGHHDGYKECAKEALGWIDENPLEFIEPQEIKPIK
ncbi:hypothetical protein Ami103574_06100 [Aminipila butyrica]|uniref:Uncharacterized protein n=1 Tax=Aminipila butyrica TaxID=433296 RepID=A0A858BUQ5_9FIRM|nr:hypothetical protein [Aminipila butyrica]QIB68919.1 hypothetical protein Ami103574_06100 [Aminipila butyrica]